MNNDEGTKKPNDTNNQSINDDKKLYMSFDLSTQSIKIIITNQSLHILYQDSISFDEHLPEFKTENGIHRHPDGVTITSPTLMWVKSVDLILMRLLLSNKVSISDICMVSGTAQQHGSVYWQTSGGRTLKHLKADSMMADQLQGCFMTTDSPIWMDSSTTNECQQIENRCGGKESLARLTGSRAFERFTGSQIYKFYQKNRYCYRTCERISLVSSFLASLMHGSVAPIDYSDGSGMNLLDIEKKVWCKEICEVCAPNLTDRLKEAVPTNHVIGNISPYMVERYGFNKNCRIVAFTGDNPASLIGMRLKEGDMTVSLGTSDTLIFWSKDHRVALQGHVFVNPITNEEFMSLLCFKNGSLARENICSTLFNKSWTEFNESLVKTKPGNDGNIGIYFHEMEILPPVQGIYRWNADDVMVTSFNADVECRAIIEGQFLAKKYHAKKMGFDVSPSTRILATGGASCNKTILQILCDVMGCNVYALEETNNSACLGGIYNCVLASAADPKVRYYELVETLPTHKLVCTPNTEAVKIYEKMLARYGRLENSLGGNQT